MKLNYVRGDRYLRQGMPSQLEKNTVSKQRKHQKKKEKKNLSPDEQIKMNDFLTLGGDGGVYIACLKATVYKFPSLREHTDGNVPLNPSLK